MAEKFVSYKKRLSELICPDAILFNLDKDNVEDIHELLLNKLLMKVKNHQLSVFYKLKSLLIAREELGTLAIGQGIAIPYIDIPEEYNEIFPQPAIAIGISKNGVKYHLKNIDGRLICKPLDEKPVHIVFLSLIPRRKEIPGFYIKIMSKISRFLKEKENREGLIKKETAKEVINFIRAYERKYKAGEIKLWRKKVGCDFCGKLTKLKNSVKMILDTVCTYNKKKLKQGTLPYLRLCSACAKKLYNKIKRIEWIHQIER